VADDYFDWRRWNMTIKQINKHKDPGLYYYRKAGVFVHGIRYPGNAQSAGLARNDIITSIDKQEVMTLDNVEEIYNAVVEDEAREKKVLIDVLRSGYKKWIVLDYSRDYERED